MLLHLWFNVYYQLEILSLRPDLHRNGGGPTSCWYVCHRIMVLRIMVYTDVRRPLTDVAWSLTVLWDPVWGPLPTEYKSTNVGGMRCKNVYIEGQVTVVR